MSKLSQLKQDAYQAGKKRDWNQAVTIYEQILELDKSNPTLINELGDLCLKSGQTSAGVKHFLSAAAKYRHSGLLNNAVAIYKKILRYDADNMNAHWYLAESRANQGLLMEGAQHALLFLSNQEDLGTDIKEIFLKRCTQLTELYPENSEILESLLQVFRMWNMGMEAGRTQIQLACQILENGDQNKAQKMVADSLEQLPELINYPEHSLWLEKTGPTDQPAASNDFNSVSLDLPKVEDPEPGAALPEKSVPTAIPAAPAEPAAAIESSTPWADAPTPVDQETSFGDLSFADEPAIPEQPAEPAIDAPDDGGCFNLDMDDGCSFDDLIAQATAGVTDDSSEPEEFSGIPKGLSNDDALPDGKKDSVDEAGSINLLDELLAEDYDSGDQNLIREEETIIEEIGSQLGGDTDSTDPASLYEMAMVYLEMGMYDQACESFQKASCHAEFAVRAHEMWGITLLREGKVDQAIAVLTDGLDVPEEGSREYLGLLYHIARAHEQGTNNDEAMRIFEMIHQQDPGFLDVGRRLAKLATLS